MRKPDKKNSFSKKLLKWHSKNARTFPWKETNDPYKIWLSEIILQQTQVVQGLPYFLKIIKSFPTVQHLAKAKEDAVMKLWQGLGYYSRARNLHSGAKHIATELKGTFPSDYSGWLKVKGVGPYSAAAIVSFAYNQPHAVVDGNVFRVLARCFGIKTPVDSAEGKKQFTLLANELLDKKHAGIFNQAIMDLGATVCKPSSPDCDACPIKTDCVARKKNLISVLPVKKKKTELKKRFFHFIIAKTKTGLLVEKRNASDIWKGLYQFPLIESKKFLTEKKLSESELLKKISLTKRIQFTEVCELVQLLSHQKIFAKFYLLNSGAKKCFPLEEKNTTQLKKTALPKMLDSFIKNYSTLV